MKIKSTLLALAFVIPGGLVPSTGQALDAVKIGTLSCSVSAGLGLVITSSRDMNCQFRPSGGGRQEAYRGTIRRYGLDIGATSRGVLVWGVVAGTGRPVRGALAGEYAGATAEATVGAGLGVNALAGGSGRAFSLQPVSVEGQLGLNLAGGCRPDDAGQRETLRALVQRCRPDRHRPAVSAGRIPAAIFGENRCGAISHDACE